jgi:elongation factor 1-beta
MGQVIIGFKIYPKSIETDLEKLRDDIGKALPNGTRISKSSIEPIAFGLSALIVDIVMPEEEAISDKIEEIVGSNGDIENFEVVSQRRVLRL